MTDENTVVQADVNPPVSDAAPVQPPPEAPETEQEKPAKPPEGFVPHQALHQERIQRRRLERDLAEERMKWETANKRLADLAQRFAPPEPKAPDPNEDPVGAITHETKTIKEKLSEWERREQERLQQENFRQQQSAIERHWSMAAQSFAQKQPDFPQAYDHLFRNAMEEFTEAGYDENTAGQLVQGYWRDIVVKAQQDGINPAERMYNLAKRRGFKAAKSEDKIETIANGTKAASPLATAAGKAPSRLTAETIANMSQDEFDKLTDADFKRIFG